MEKSPVIMGNHAPEPATIRQDTGIYIPNYMTEWQEIDREEPYNTYRH